MQRTLVVRRDVQILGFSDFRLLSLLQFLTETSVILKICLNKSHFHVGIRWKDELLTIF